MKNFHLPLPDETYSELRAASKRSRLSATALARQAIDAWLAAEARAKRHEAIAAYAAKFAGTEFDLDSDLEATGVEYLIQQNETW